MIRSDESPRHWSTGGLAAILRLGTSVGHGHDDYFSLVLHGKGRLLYPDISVIQYEPRLLNWTAEGERKLDWVAHGPGRLYPGNPAAYRPSMDLIPYYGWIFRAQQACQQVWSS